MFKELAFLILRLLLKRIDLVLSSPKWILNLPFVFADMSP